MFNTVMNWAFGTPWGIAFTSAVAAALLLVILSAIFKPIRRALGNAGARLKKIRITTEPKKPKVLPILPPPRWFVRPVEGRRWFILNTGAGNAYEVQLDPGMSDFRVLNSGYWPTLPAKSAGEVLLLPGPDTFMWHDSTASLRLSWTDDNGTRHSEFVEVLEPSRYASLGSDLPRISEGKYVKLPDDMGDAS
jgi:hypothetical protein